MKVDLRKFYGSIPTEQLRALRDDIAEELKERAREARISLLDWEDCT